MCKTSRYGVQVYNFFLNALLPPSFFLFFFAPSCGNCYVLFVMYDAANRYSTLRGPTSSPCFGFKKRLILFFRFFWAFRPFLVFCSKSGNWSITKNVENVLRWKPKQKNLTWRHYYYYFLTCTCWPQIWVRRLYLLFTNSKLRVDFYHFL